MADSGVKFGTGLGFTGLLTILFIGLKLTEYIDWSWWWVFCPVWVNCMTCICVFIFAISVVLLKECGK